MARGASRRLDERGRRAEIALLVGVQDGHERDFGQVESFAEQIDPDQAVELAEAQVADQGHALQRVDVRVQVAHAQAVLLVVLGEVLGHALGQRGDEDPLVALGPRAHLRHEVVHLGARGPHGDLRIHEPGGPDDLLGDRPTFPRLARPRPLPAGQGQLVRSRRGRDVEGLADEHRELLERERPIVEGRRQAESVLDERLLPRPVARVHPADLRDGDVRLVDDDDGVLREVVHQRGRILARLAPGQMARVVLDPVAVADLPQHLHVEQRPLLEPLGLEEPPARPEEAEPLPQLVRDARQRLLELRRRRHVVARGVDPRLRDDTGGGALERVEGHEPLHAVAPELHPKRLRLRGDGEDLDDVAPNPERAAAEIVVVALVLHGHERPDERVPVHLLADLDRHVHPVIGLGLPDAVDARHRGHHDHVPPLEERGRRGVTHPVDLVVDEGVFLDIGVRLRDVGLRLVVVVVRDEVLGGVLREERLELAVELGGQRLVRRDDEGGPLEPGDDVGQGERLSAPRDPEEHRVRLAVGEHPREPVDGARLIPRGGELRGELEQPAQSAVGTATRYLRHESRNDVACGCLNRCMENRNWGCTGSRMSRSRASSSVRLPFCRLHLRHAATTLTQVVCPPRDRGITWSTVSFSPRRRQYWHV